MLWIYEKSATWRRIVAVTKQSPAAMLAFTATMFVVPYGLGKVVMSGTNPQQESELERQLRQRATLEHKVCLLPLPVRPGIYISRCWAKLFCTNKEQGSILAMAPLWTGIFFHSTFSNFP